MPANRANHIALHPSLGISPSAGKLKRNVQLIVIGLHRIWLRHAQWNDSAETHPCTDRWRQNNAQTLLHHFRFPETLLKINRNNGSPLRVVAQRQVDTAVLSKIYGDFKYGFANVRDAFQKECLARANSPNKGSSNSMTRFHLTTHDKVRK